MVTKMSLAFSIAIYKLGGNFYILESKLVLILFP